jgi:hypothetical protein
MKTYNPESRAEKDKKVFQNFSNLVRVTLRHQLVEWMKNDQKSKEEFEAETENKFKNFSFNEYLEKMV